MDHVDLMRQCPKQIKERWNKIKVLPKKQGKTQVSEVLQFMKVQAEEREKKSREREKRRT